MSGQFNFPGHPVSERAFLGNGADPKPAPPAPTREDRKTALDAALRHAASDTRNWDESAILNASGIYAEWIATGKAKTN